ncbi:hypothetical protein EVU94_14620 [Flavobacteriaceae bacterium 144Ye]|nr:hypothetical protein EVU94_14620 [Flavobacteriaceae bacterium 144Ye]
MRGLAVNLASTHRTENPRGFSEVGENKQLLIAIVGGSIYFLLRFLSFILMGFCLVSKTSLMISSFSLIR